MSRGIGLAAAALAAFALGDGARAFQAREIPLGDGARAFQASEVPLGRRLPYHERLALQRIRPADLVLRNGKIVTVDESRPAAEALAVSGDTIAAVGSNE